MSYDIVRKLIKVVGCILALSIGLVIPIAFGIVNFINLQNATRAEARFHAHYIEKMVQNGKLLFGAEGLREIVGSVAATSEGDSSVSIRSDTGTVLLDWGPSDIAGGITATSAITIGGEAVGYVVVRNETGSLVRLVLLLAMLGCALALISFVGMTRLPLQALDDANAQLSAHEKQLEETNARLDAALSNMVQGVSLFDSEMKVKVANERYSELYGLPSDLVRPGTTLRQILEARAAMGHYSHLGDERAYIEAAIAKFGDAVSEVIELKDGRFISVVRRPLPNGGLISTHEDITARRKADAKIAHMAMHDTLTGLPNRTLLREKLDEALHAASPSQLVAMHCLDLDRFKAVNDTLGHPMGDALLRAVADRLRTCVRGSDIVARLGGDEFSVLQPAIASPDQAAALAQRLIDVLSEPFEIDGHRMVIGASVGIAIAPIDGTDATALLKNADLALYSSKSEGRSRFRFFEVDMDSRIQARRKLELDLNSALALNQFELFYQPLVDLRSNDVVAMEALLRWNHPERGRVSPAEFVPIIEEIGLIEQVGSWVLRRACAEAATWPDNISVSVNLSPHQFKSGTLALDVAAALSSTGLAPTRLELEITESALMQNTQATLATLTQIRNLGVRIAMDDFGTGYSSLSYLHSFPFDKIKIDKCFVQNLTEKPDSGHILRAVVGLGASLRMQTTAEGVETLEQLEQLRDEGCTQVQGYYFSAPRPAHEVPALLQITRERAGVAA